MTVYGYVRVSTDKQGADGLGAAAQTAAIQARFPDAVLVTEVASGAKVRRELEALLGSLTPADTLVTAKLDRLGRSTIDVITKLLDLAERSITVVVLDLGLDTSTPMGRFSATILAAVAELERSFISERTTVALAAAAKRGIVPGRKVDSALATQVKHEHGAGVSVTDLGIAYGISRATVYRYIERKP